MPCFHPLEGYAKVGGGLTFKKSQSNGNPMRVPCGQCIGCRIDRSKAWAIRCVHEASLYEDNQFITLTYAPEHLPRSGSLVVSHSQRFLKRYRKAVAPRKLRYFMCGEYGESLSRPHYHYLVFNHRFDDIVPYRRTEHGQLYTSERLSELWGNGFATIGDVSFESAAYVARYALKKITGEAAKRHYENLDTETGEVHSIRAEFVTMSRGGRDGRGIGAEWFDRFHPDVYNHDYCVHQGRKVRSPRYYDKLYERLNAEKAERLKIERQLAGRRFADNNTPERLAVREEVLRSKLKTLTRELDETQDF